jgi:hypothetical protein
MGKVKIRFVKKNPYGVLNHDVTLESGVTIHTPMRVVSNGQACELIFTLIRQPGMSDEKLAGRRRPHQPGTSVPRTNVACGFPALRSTGRLPA